MILQCVSNLSLVELICALLGAFASVTAIAGAAYKLGLTRAGRGTEVASLQERLEIAKAGLYTTKHEIQVEREKLAVHLQKQNDLEKIMLGASDIWLRPTGFDFGSAATAVRNSHPIITVANFKGGVAKSTVAANLASYFAKDLKKRVLLIDLDYQGTLSDTVLSAAGIQDAQSSAHKLLSANHDVEAIFHESVSLNHILPKSRIFPSFYDLAKIENSLMFQWLMMANMSEIRFSLHRYLHSRKFQEAFDITIIDAPPRFVTAMANAACASTHILIPSCLDGNVVPATLNTLKVFYDLKTTICPSLNVMGIVPTMTAKQTGFTETEQKWLDHLKTHMPKYWPTGDLPRTLEGTPIYKRARVSAAAGSKVYPFGSMQDASSKMFAKLGSEILASVTQ